MTLTCRQWPTLTGWWWAARARLLLSRLVEWHQRNECVNLARIPPAARRGDTSVMRMLLRYRALTEPAAAQCQAASQLDWADDTMGKEPVHLLAGLQGHAVDIPRE